jgi:hypothetical protein
MVEVSGKSGEKQKVTGNKLIKLDDFMSLKKTSR